MSEIPTARYVKSDDVHIAYQVLGKGPPDILFVPGFVSHLEAVWHIGARVAALAALARYWSRKPCAILVRAPG
jgi:hypothetical protein